MLNRDMLRNNVCRSFVPASFPASPLPVGSCSTHRRTASLCCEAGHPRAHSCLQENEDLSFEEVKTNIKSALKRRVDDDFSMLMFAAQNGDLEECSSILRRGLDVNMVDYDGHTTLHMAAKCGMYKVVELLLEAGADKDAVDRWGNTPLQVAIMNQQSPVAELLTSWKATLQVLYPQNVSPLRFPNLPRTEIIPTRGCNN